jgi:hypothetical protein
MSNLDLSSKYDPKIIRKKTIRRILFLGFISILIVVLALFCIIVFFPLTAALPETIRILGTAKNIDWGLLEGVISAVTFALLSGGLIFTLFEYVNKAIRDERESAVVSFTIYTRLFDRLMDPAALEARRWVILNLPTLEDSGSDEEKWLEIIKDKLAEIPDNWNDDRPPGKIYLKEVLTLLDYIGFVARHYWNLENEIATWMSPSIAKVWERIYLYVEDEAKRRDEPDFYSSAREFGEYCVDWRKDHYPKSIIIDNGT